MWIFNQMTSMQQEIDGLRDTVRHMRDNVTDQQSQTSASQDHIVDIEKTLDHMKKLLFDDDLLDDLDDFDKGVRGTSTSSHPKSLA
jgi:uncharacterized coiled-coil DUF342 family protein